MRWDEAITAVMQRLNDDAVLTAALGSDHIVRASESTSPPLPGVVYQVTSSQQRENEEVVFTRWDMRAATLDEVVAIEERLRANLDRTLPETVSGLPMWLEYVDGWDVPEAPAGTAQRTVLFRFTVLREH
ncbi:MAG: hypothetical protein JO040_01805 [Gemmatimonadetes bacterium]|nr:hypothetical protein [Gemmatimonadota bacterium]